MHAQQMPQPGSAVDNRMDLSQFHEHIRTLITLDETDAPIVSCYVHRGAGQISARSHQFDGRVMEIRGVLGSQELGRFELAYARVQRYLVTKVHPTTRGVAVFARAGTRPFFLGLQFQVPLPDRLSVNSTPDIYHLVELKDTYDRYVVLISTEERARIVEVTLGAMTREVWTERPDLRDRVGREWTHEHYQNHRRDRDKRFVKEKLEILEKLMAAGGHTHLILAGSPPMTARIRNCLPTHLKAKLIDVVPATSSARTNDVVAATLSSFIEHEQRRSLDSVAELVSALRRGGLGASGTAATFEALRRGQADVLVMAQQYDAGPSWICRHCGWGEATPTRPVHCPECASTELRSADLKEVMVTLAERQSLEVDIVPHTEVLMDLGGVGCLLRYATTKQDEWA